MISFHRKRNKDITHLLYTMTGVKLQQ